MPPFSKAAVYSQEGAFIYIPPVPLPSVCSSFSGFKNLEMEDKPMEEQESICVLIVKKKRIAVSKEVYMAYYKHKEREKYLDRLAEEKIYPLKPAFKKAFR